VRYYPHALGHWIGMDTHDTPTVATKNPIEPGCVFTIEPGLYFPADDLAVPKSLRGVGVRIEDDVALGGKGGVEVLSGGLPVGRREIEELVQELRQR
jgi:Xaa-Pro aminopeptidase